MPSLDDCSMKTVDKVPFAGPLDEFFGHRANLVEAREEKWRPPLFLSPRSRWFNTLGYLRRFLDLQAGSIWNDLAGLLPHVSGLVLDVGCGAQPYRTLFSTAARYQGIDTVTAKAHFGYEVPDTIYYAGDVWPVADESVDFILCTETLEHVLEPRQFLLEARRCLRPGGCAVLTVPFAARWHYIPYDYWRITPSGLQHLFRNCGFMETRVYARGNAGTVACYKNMAIILPLLMPLGSTPIVRWTLRLLAIPLIPVLVILAAIGNLTLRGRGGDDCLGYTVLVHKGL
jgi:SAM-dependent methyltransferase